MTGTERGGWESAVSTDGGQRDAGRFVRSPSVLWRRAGEGLLLARQGEEIIHISGSASVVWEVLGEPVSLEEAVEILADAFGEDAARIRAELTPVFRELRERGLVVGAADADPGRPGADA